MKQFPNLIVTNFMKQFLLLVFMLCSCSAEKTDRIIESSHLENSRKDNYPHGQRMPDISMTVPEMTEAQIFENELLLRVLKEEFGNQKGFNILQQRNREQQLNGYTVIRPRASVYGERDNTHGLCVIISKQSKLMESVICPMLEKLVEKNRSEPLLSLTSAQEEGFIVDYPNAFGKYFRDTKSGGWECWRKDNPDANSWTTVSLPAVDLVNKILIVYIGVQYGWLAGRGGLLIYSYSDNDLKLLQYYTLWIS